MENNPRPMRTYLTRAMICSHVVLFDVHWLCCAGEKSLLLRPFIEAVVHVHFRAIHMASVSKFSLYPQKNQFLELF